MNLFLYSYDKLITEVRYLRSSYHQTPSLGNIWPQQQSASISSKLQFPCWPLSYSCIWLGLFFIPSLLVPEVIFNLGFLSTYVYLKNQRFLFLCAQPITNIGSRLQPPCLMLQIGIGILISLFLLIFISLCIFISIFF